MDVQERAAIAEVEHAAQAWAVAIQRRDLPSLEGLLAAEYVLQAPGLGRMPRASWLTALPDYEITSYSFDEIRVHMYGETAVMQSRYRQQATYRGEDRSGELFLTDVWVRRHGRWQVVARHSCFAPPVASVPVASAASSRRSEV